MQVQNSGNNNNDYKKTYKSNTLNMALDYNNKDIQTDIRMYVSTCEH